MDIVHSDPTLVFIFCLIAIMIRAITESLPTVMAATLSNHGVGSSEIGILANSVVSRTLIALVFSFPTWLATMLVLWVEAFNWAVVCWAILSIMRSIKELINHIDSLDEYVATPQDNHPFFISRIFTLSIGLAVAIV